MTIDRDRDRVKKRAQPIPYSKRNQGTFHSLRAGERRAGERIKALRGPSLATRPRVLASQSPHFPSTPKRPTTHTQSGGGDGSRTRVRKMIYTTFYMFRRSLISKWAGEPTRIPLHSVHEIDSLGVAVAPSQASLLSSHPRPAGVSRDASWLIKPRERDLRNLHLFV